MIAAIFGNSTLNKNVVKECKDKGYYLVACDGGYKYFLNEKISPNLFVGDFDTFTNEEEVNADVIIKLNKIKDDTDTIYACKHLIELGYDEFHLYGCLGGKIEHTIANIQFLSYLNERNIKCYLHDENDENILFLTSKDIIFKNNMFGNISIFSYNKESIISIKNLQYELDNYKLTNSFPLGVSNSFIGKEAKIEIKEGKILVVVSKTFLNKEEQK